ncbi:MAG: hypothetical protein AMXMBFR82_35590 [Candidatus Hydrogenedentota bacterium]
MKVLLDVNVLLDFLQRREPHFEDAASVLDAILYKNVEGVLPAHAVTIISYFLERDLKPQEVKNTIEWLLRSFIIAACDFQILTLATASTMSDFEDAVVAVSAKTAGCDYVVTRNVADFTESPVKAIDPRTFLNGRDCT